MNPQIYERALRRYEAAHKTYMDTSALEPLPVRASVERALDEASHEWFCYGRGEAVRFCPCGKVDRDGQWVESAKPEFKTDTACPACVAKYRAQLAALQPVGGAL